MLYPWSSFFECRKEKSRSFHRKARQTAGQPWLLTQISFSLHFHRPKWFFRVGVDGNEVKWVRKTKIFTRERMERSQCNLHALIEQGRVPSFGKKERKNRFAISLPFPSNWDRSGWPLPHLFPPTSTFHLALALLFCQNIPLHWISIFSAQ